MGYRRILLFFLIACVCSTLDAQSPQSAALHLRMAEASTSNGMARTDFLIPPEILNNSFTLRLSIKSGDYDWLGGTYRPGYIRVMDAQGRTRIAVARQLSPHILFGMAGGPSFSGFPSKYAENGYEIPVTRQEYEDYWVVFKRPTANDDGYFRVYRDHEMTKFVTGDYDGRYFSYPILKGSDTNWYGGAAAIVIGDPQSVRQNFKIAQLDMWTTNLDEGTVVDWTNKTAPTPINPIIQSLTRKQLHTLAQIPSRDKLYFHFAGTDEGVKEGLWKKSAELGVAPSALQIKLEGEANLSTDLPHWVGYQGRVAEESPTGLGLSASATGISSIRVSAIEAGSALGMARGLPISRTLYVGKSSSQYQYSYAFRKVLGESENLLDVSGLLPGTDYKAVVEYRDALGNIRVAVAPARTQGTAPAINPARKSLHVKGPSDLRSPAYGLPINEAWTFRAFVKRNPGDASESLIRFMDKLTTCGGYQAITLGLQSGTGALQISRNDGSTGMKSAYTGLLASDPNGKILADGSWNEVWFQYQPPTATATGKFRILKGKTQVGFKELPMAQTIYDDVNFKKWHVRMYVGVNPHIAYRRWEDAEGKTIYAKADLNVGPVSWWTRYLNDAEIQSLSGKDLMSLSKEQRLDDDLFYHVQFHEENNKIVPDYGAVLGSFTNLEASEDATRGECYPETEPAMISYSDDIPSLSSASADKTAPTAGKISIIASPTKNSATFSVEGGSDNVGVTYRVVRVYAQSNLQQKVGMDVPVDNSGSVITTNLSPATHYWFQAVFYDAAGNFSGSNVVDLITLGEPPLSRPDKPSNLRIQFREPI